jgi:hypothetical protein|uniref:Uncharacterized protein n=1 Tax=viral metagenome TaxID=1070528 RepID=A0A6C0ESZ5_9ZZZZ
MDNPKLIDPSMKYYLYNTLQSCHTTRVQVYTTIFNVVVFVLFIALVGGALYYSYKRKLTPYEKHQKMIREQEIILSKIRYYQNERVGMKSGATSSYITNLPAIDTPY